MEVLKVESDDENKVYLAELKYCENRVGRVYNKKMVVCCGNREINVRECITCNVHNAKNC